MSLFGGPIKEALLVLLQLGQRVCGCGLGCAVVMYKV